MTRMEEDRIRAIVREEVNAARRSPRIQEIDCDLARMIRDGDIEGIEKRGWQLSPMMKKVVEKNKLVDSVRDYGSAVSKNRSLVCEIQGIPPNDHGKRLYLFTSWTFEGIREAWKKAALATADYSDAFTISRNLGETGYSGDEWFSFHRTMPVSVVREKSGDKRADRYGMRRWIWTTGEESDR